MNLETVRAFITKHCGKVWALRLLPVVLPLCVISHLVFSFLRDYVLIGVHLPQQGKSIL